MLRSGELDAIIISLPFEPEGVVTQALYDEPFIVLIPASHPWNQKERVNANELSSEPVMLLGEGHCFRDQVLDVCPGCLHSDALGTDLQQTLEGSSLETIRYMVESGVGITVLPCTAAMSAKHLVKVRRFEGANPSRRVALAWRSSFPRPKAIQVLREAIVSCPLTCVTMIDDPPAAIETPIQQAVAH
jgi:LysR family hydrogen peroxide-inducible transcriptional activator